MLRIYYTLLLACALLTSCSSTHESSEWHLTPDSLRHASLLSIARADSFVMVTVKNAWSEGEGLHRYILVPDTAPMPLHYPEGTLLRTPLRRAVMHNAVHAALVAELGCADAVRGVCDVEFVQTPALRRLLDNGYIADAGSSVQSDVERYISLRTDAVFTSPIEHASYCILEKVEIPLVECADYMEVSPLACAEWVRFYGRLLGKAAVADSIFNAVCREYEALRGLTAGCEWRPKLMCELKSSSAWYVPGGASTMGCMYADAGADYLFSHLEGNGSVPLAFEAVLDKAAEADVWLIKYNSEVDKTYSSLLAEFEGYSHFRPFKENNIYACNTRNKRLFEDRSFHPERMLRELVALFHPELLPGYEMKYYERMR